MGQIPVITLNDGVRHTHPRERASLHSDTPRNASVSCTVAGSQRA